MSSWSPDSHPTAFPTEGLAALLGDVATGSEDLVANRHEWKYLISQDLAQRLKAAIAPRLEVEEFIPGRSKTLVHSIYFDSSDFILYRRAMQTESNLKFRIRTYGTSGQAQELDATGFFECKIGLTGKKYKLRNTLPVVQAADFLEPFVEPTRGTGRLSITTNQKFLLKARRVLGEFHMFARLTVSYVRQAFVTHDGELRITFDEHYRAARIDEGSSTPLEGMPRQMDDLVLEIKFVGDLPAWLRDILASYGLAEGGVPFSKFRCGVGLCYPELIHSSND